MRRKNDEALGPAQLFIYTPMATSRRAGTSMENEALQAALVLGGEEAVRSLLFEMDRCVLYVCPYERCRLNGQAFDCSLCGGWGSLSVMSRMEALADAVQMQAWSRVGKAL